MRAAWATRGRSTMGCAEADEGSLPSGPKRLMRTRLFASSGTDRHDVITALCLHAKPEGDITTRAAAGA